MKKAKPQQKKSYTKLSYTDMKRLDEELGQALSKSERVPGKYTYRGVLSDDNIARKLGLNEGQVAYFRKKHYGDLDSSERMRASAKARGASPMAEFMRRTNERLEALERDRELDVVRPVANGAGHAVHKR